MGKTALSGQTVEISALHKTVEDMISSGSYTWIVITVAIPPKSPSGGSKLGTPGEQYIEISIARQTLEL